MAFDPSFQHAGFFRKLSKSGVLGRLPGLYRSLDQLTTSGRVPETQHLDPRTSATKDDWASFVGCHQVDLELRDEALKRTA